MGEIILKLADGCKLVISLNSVDESSPTSSSSSASKSSVSNFISSVHSSSSSLLSCSSCSVKLHSSSVSGVAVVVGLAMLSFSFLTCVNTLNP